MTEPQIFENLCNMDVAVIEPKSIILNNFHRFRLILLGFLTFEPKMIENLSTLTLDSKTSL